MVIVDKGKHMFMPHLSILMCTFRILLRWHDSGGIGIEGWQWYDRGATVVQQWGANWSSPNAFLFCRAGLKLFRTSLSDLLCRLGARSMLYHHNMGSKSGKITDKIVIFHEF
jgi:hypothetical protein